MARQIFRQEALDRLASPDLLDRPVRIVRPVGWLGLGILLATALVALGWTAVTKAPVKVAGVGIVQPAGSTDPATSGKRPIAVLYIPAPDSWRIKPGMVVEIDLSTVRREEVGYLLGTVAEVTPSPLAPDQLVQTLKDEQLVRRLTRDSLPVRATIALQTGPETANGLRWSTARGAEIDVHPGTRFDGQIVVGHRSLLSLLIPRLGQTVEGDGV